MNISCLRTTWLTDQMSRYFHLTCFQWPISLSARQDERVELSSWKHSVSQVCTLQGQHLSRVVNWRLKDSSPLVGNRTSSQKLHATIRITVHRRGKILDFPRVLINIVSGLHQFLTPELHVSDDVDLNIISMSCVWSTWLHESVAHWRSDSVLLLCQQRNKEWSFLQY